MKNITKFKSFLNQNIRIVMAAQIVLALLVMAAPLPDAAAAQLADRNIRLSDAAPSGTSITTGPGSGTKVIYRVEFGVATIATAIGGIVIDFCSNSPIPGDSCSAPTGFNVNRSTTTVNNQTGTGTGAFAVTTTDATNNRIIITRATASTMSGTASFELGNATNGLTNPSVTGSLYARIYTYATQAAANAHNTAAPSGYIDYGGVAMSIASTITITARVQETLLFCLSASAPTANCGGLTAPALTIGHGAVKTIDSTAIDTGTIYSQVSTNAQSGVTVRIRNANGNCGGLSADGGTTCTIPPVNAGAATTPATNMVAGTAAFGLRIASSGGVTPSAPYNGASGDLYGMDTTTAGSNVTTTFGSQALTSSGPVNNINNTWTFAATASNTTPAGIYTANIAAIATGTF